MHEMNLISTFKWRFIVQSIDDISLQFVQCNAMQFDQIEVIEERREFIFILKCKQ